MKPMIHVVEDEKQLNDLVRSYLEAEGYDVRPFYTYEEAMAVMEAKIGHTFSAEEREYLSLYLYMSLKTLPLTQHFY